MGAHSLGIWNVAGLFVRMDGVRTVVLDADDTLWHNMNLFVDTHERYARLLEPFVDDVTLLEAALNETERRNIEHFGYGIKGFTLSMVETAVEVSDGRVSGEAIQAIIDLGREMLAAPVELLPQVAEVVEFLSERYRLGVITKGDLLNQETKVARSGLADFFDFVEVVSEKDVGTYRSVLQRQGVQPSELVMVGNSLKSDIAPILEMGGRAVYVPYAVTWVHEEADLEPEWLAPGRFRQLASLKALPGLLANWN